MRIQVIHAKTLPEALAIARADHGENAIVLDTEETPDGAIVRLGVDTAAPLDAPASEPDAPAPAPTQYAAADLPPASAALSSWPAIRQPDPLPNAGTSDRIAKALAWHGVPPLVTSSLLIAAEASGETDPAAALAIALERVLRFGKPEDLRAPLAFVGPPGAGKTATLIKLAAARSGSGAAIQIVNTDLETSGAVARIGGFAEAMGLTPVHAANADDIRRALTQDAETFVDTVGRAPADDDDIAAAAAEIEAAGHGVLTLSAAIAPAEAAELAECFAAAGAESLIVTQLDIARRVGAMLAAADAGGLVLAGVSVGRKIGDGLRPLDGASLARLILAPPQPLPKWTTPAKAASTAAPTTAYANVQAYSSKGAAA